MGQSALKAVLMAALISFAIPAQAKTIQIRPDGMAAAFNAASKSLKMDVRLAFNSCEDQKKTTCSYQANPSIQAIAQGDTDQLADSILFIWTGSKKTTLDWITIQIVSMALFSPDAAPDERGVALKSLVDEAVTGKANSVTLHGAKYTLTATDGMGVWLTVEPAKR